MNIEYTFKIRQTTLTTIFHIQNVISHIHYDYIGTNESNEKAVCQGVLPFDLKPHTFISPATGEAHTTPAVFDKDNYIPYDQVTDEVLVSWLNNSLPLEIIQIFQEIIRKKLMPQE